MRNSFVAPTMFDQKQALIAVRTVTFAPASSANLIFDHNFKYVPKTDVFFYNPAIGSISNFRQVGFAGGSTDTLLADYQLSYFATTTQVILTLRTYQGTTVGFGGTTLLLVIYK